jgi:hypothetical protein
MSLVALVKTTEDLDAIKHIIVDLYGECSTCGTKCGCVQCGMYLPCVCKAPPCINCGWVHRPNEPHLCRKCGITPCPCATQLNSNSTSNSTTTGSGMQSIINFVQITNNVFNYISNSAAQITSGIQFYAANNSPGGKALSNYITSQFGTPEDPLCPKCHKDFLKECVCPCQTCGEKPCVCNKLPKLISKICDDCGYVKPLCHCNPATLAAVQDKTKKTVKAYFDQLACSTCKKFPCECKMLAPALTTGSAYYNPSMLDRGTDEEKSARQKAIEFRNAMLGDNAKDLYSSHGLRIQSKKWPEREYVFYSHHVSCQVYDHGINIGRLDVHADGYNVPMGDTHLAAILKVLHDEEDMVKTAQFSRVRDI